MDTSILVYSDDAASSAKQARAVSLLATHRRDNSLVVSLQVLQEYYAATTRKFEGDSPPGAEQGWKLSPGAGWSVSPNADVIAAIELHRLSATRISFWDAMIVHAARLANASVLFSEDLSHGSTLSGVTVRNPFAEQ